MTAEMMHHYRVLACVARADGHVAASERELILQSARADGLGASDIEHLTRLLAEGSEFDSDACLAESARSIVLERLLEVLRDAYLVSHVDQGILVSEVQAIDRLLELRGIPREKRELLHVWARTAAEHHLDGLELLAECQAE